MQNKPKSGMQNRPMWAVRYAKGDTPAVFAASLEEILQQMTDEGYAIVSQMFLREVCIVTGRKIGLPLCLPKKNANGESRVVYNFKRDDVYCSKTFTSMQEALREVKKTLQEEDVLPIRLIHMDVTSYEPYQFVGLLRSYGQELEEKEPLS